jgi:hypothetical protein
VCVVLVDCIIAPSRGVRCLCITGNGLAVTGVYGVGTALVHFDTRVVHFLWGRGGSDVVVGWWSRHGDITRRLPHWVT